MGKVVQRGGLSILLLAEDTRGAQPSPSGKRMVSSSGIQHMQIFYSSFSELCNRVTGLNAAFPSLTVFSCCQGRLICDYGRQICPPTPAKKKKVQHS